MNQFKFPISIGEYRDDADSVSYEFHSVQSIKYCEDSVYQEDFKIHHQF